MPSRRKMIRLVLSHAGMAAAGVGLMVSATMASGSPPVQAQGDGAPADGLLVVPGADGGPVGLRLGPAPDQPVVATLVPYELVVPLGPVHHDGATRWLTVKTSRNHVGWIDGQYLAAVGAISPPASPSPEPLLAEAPPPASVPAPADATTPAAVGEAAPPALVPPPALASASASTSPSTATVAEAPPQPGRPVEVETKLKFPEAKGRHQEVTVWVTRDGVPVSGRDRHDLYRGRRG